MKVLLIDNNDSFTYNLLHLIKSVCNKEDIIKICLRNKLTMTMVSDFDRIVISPGSGIPSEAGIIGQTIKTYEGRTPILGICLGYQAIAEYYGANIRNMEKPAHGIRSTITINDHSRLFLGMNKKIMAGRYHSWRVLKENFPDCLKVTSVDDEGNIMSLSHRKYNIHGLQFHPESFMTDCGKTIMSNFLNNLKG